MIESRNEIISTEFLYLIIEKFFMSFLIFKTEIIVLIKTCPYPLLSLES